ncbi:MAG: MBL fold metallo-hydrolase [Thermoanaerobaculia bacterium]
MSIEGHSVAGEETWFRIHPPGLAFDVGRGAPAQAGSRDLFVSHGHLDHALGVPYVLSQRTLHHHAPTRVFCPLPLAEVLREFVGAAERMERVEYRCEIAGLAPGDRVEVGRDLAIEAFSTDHVVPSLGFHLLRRRRRLKEAFRACAGGELARLRGEGIAIDDAWEEIWLSYCGDTGPGVWELAPRLPESRLLMIECTFLGEAVRQHGSAYKHLHFDDLVEQAAKLERHEAIVLHHLSRRHTIGELRHEIEARLPELAARIHLLGEVEV